MKKDLIRTKEIMDTFSENICMCVYDLQTCTYFGKNMKSKFYPASMFKVIIALTILHAIENEQIMLFDLIEIIPQNWTNEIQIFPDDVGKRISCGETKMIDELLSLMLSKSDNTASHALLSLVGIEAVERIIRRYGLEQTYFTDSYKESLLNNVVIRKREILETTAFDMVCLFKYIEDGIGIDNCISEYVKKYLHHRSSNEGRTGLYLKDYYDYYGKGGFLEVDLWKLKNIISLVQNIIKYGSGYYLIINDCCVISGKTSRYIACVGFQDESLFPLTHYNLKYIAHKLFYIMEK